MQIRHSLCCGDRSVVLRRRGLPVAIRVLLAPFAFYAARNYASAFRHHAVHRDAVLLCERYKEGFSLPNRARGRVLAEPCLDLLYGWPLKAAAQVPPRQDGRLCL
jgi:hypothetical protein